MGITAQHYLAALFTCNLPEMFPGIIPVCPQTQQIDFQRNVQIIGMAAKLAKVFIVDFFASRKVERISMGHIAALTGVQGFFDQSAMVVKQMLVIRRDVHSGIAGDAEENVLPQNQVFYTIFFQKIQLAGKCFRVKLQFQTNV